MMLMSCVSALLVLLVCSTSLRAENSTYVSQAEGKDEWECITGGIQHPCQSLNYVANYTNSVSPAVSMTVRVEGPTLLINDTITFSRVTGLTVEGSPSVTMLMCSCTNCSLVFEYSFDITIRRLHVTGCGHSLKRGLAINLRAAVIVYACYNILIQESNFTSNVGTGLAMVDTLGSVRISKSSFKNNSVCNCTDAKGLHIMFSNSPMNSHSARGNMSSYVIEDCRIESNRFEKAYDYRDSSSGGGINVQFGGDSTGNTVVLRDVTVKGNLGTWGGGMMVLFQDNATYNKVNLDNVLFTSNNASQHGGGLNVGYTDTTSDPPITNTVFIEKCNFTRNHARSGGGTSVFASQTTCVHEVDHDDDTLVFKSCLWKENTGYFSSAIDVSPFAYDTLGDLYFPHPKFVECLLISNHVLSFLRRYRENQMVNVGTFVVYGFEVLFEGWVEFRDHTSTALHVTDGTVTVLPDTSALYYNNSGYQGGGLAMFGSCLLRLLSNTNLTFINNSAFAGGGAIYHSTQNHHDFISSRSCFIKYDNRTAPTNGEKPVLSFRGNHIRGDDKRSGQAIFATTFLPCYFEQFYNARLFEYTIMEALRKIATFNFSDNEEATAMATTGRKFNFSEVTNETLSVIPGNNVRIPLKMQDEFNKTSPSVYRVVSNDAHVCQIDRQYMFDRIGITASENTTCNLELVAVGFRELYYKTEINVSKCPPGFYLNYDSKSCTCSAYSDKHAYFGISTCHDQMSFAYLSSGFWAGYDDTGALLTAPCPSSFCKTSTDNEIYRIKLPNMTSSNKLNDKICLPHRTGWLCGSCQPNYTVYFHSPTYQCGRQKLCSWGILFYFISEIVPIVIMFSVIGFFDIRFTTGTASALVFFAQIIDTVTLDMKWNTDPPDYVFIPMIGYRVIYGLFNFDFFNFEQASYCLWKNAAVLDVIAFKYTSVVFAFILLLMMVLFLKHCTVSCSQMKIKGVRVGGKNRSIIHSMSAVLVMCYAQCTNISLQILAKTKLRGAGREPLHDVTLFGGVNYFQTEHLVYAFPACICLLTIVAVPPILLLVFPSYLSIFSYCKLNETYPVHLIYKVFIKFKPFFDSFQGCYKDKLRFFSALFFVSRVVILAINSFTTFTSQTIIIMVLVLLIILGMHAVFHPFHKPEDNTNAILILLNMSVIGCLTMLAYSQDGYKDQRQVVIFALIVRIILLYLPIVFVCIHFIKRAACLLSNNRGKRLRKQQEKRDSFKRPAADDQGYVPFQEVTINSSEPAPDMDISYSYRDREDLLLST